MEGDITRLQVDAVVNAANHSLLGGGGVDGAIHRAAGPELLAACRTLGGCETGNAKLTPGFRLPADYVLHTVGPVWQGGEQAEAELLTSCYQRCMEIAESHESIRSIAFPCISTGLFGYPKAEATAIAVRSVREFLAASASDLQVVFCCFSADDAHRYRQELGIAG
jgi:O-acetyl-ADP-ribose deacetylase (regulator of RNase III)